MTKKLKILLISVLFTVVAVCLCAFAGCKVKYTVDELRQKYGLTAQVTYFLNGTGGNFNGNVYVKDLYYVEGQKPMDIGESPLLSGSTKLEINTGYNFTGWYYVETDADGKPLYADGATYSDGDEYDVSIGMKMSDTEFDFSKPLESGEHIYLCGDFYEDVKLRMYLYCIDYDGTFDKITYQEGGETLEINDREEIEYGTQDIPKTGNGIDQNINALQNKFTGYTVEGYYQYDETSQEYVQFNGWPVKYPEPDEDGERSDVILYVKMLKGDWDIVSTAADVTKLFAIGTHDYYIKEDIDGEGEAIRNINSLRGIIWGGEEGHTLKNFVITNTITSTSTRASIFGTITSTAVIKNVSFENFTVNFTLNSLLSAIDPDVNFIANSIADGAVFENVKISGSLNVTLSTDKCEVNNLTENSWLYGDKDDATYDKITVLYATCTVTDSTGNKTVYTVGNNNQTEDL